MKACSISPQAGSEDAPEGPDRTPEDPALRAYPRNRLGMTKRAPGQVPARSFDSGEYAFAQDLIVIQYNHAD